MSKSELKEGDPLSQYSMGRLPLPPPPFQGKPMIGALYY